MLINIYINEINNIYLAIFLKKSACITVKFDNECI